MRLLGKGLELMKASKVIVSVGLVGVFLLGTFGACEFSAESEAKGNDMILERNETYEEDAYAPGSEQLIRFHVLANSDREEDQELKRAVRDAVLQEVSPKLAAAQSLEESRQILKQVRPDIERIGRSVVKIWGEDYSVNTEYGVTPFPTKSYGSLVLPAGNYEALRVVIGEGQGSNWWCVLFPPLCFVDINQSTAVQVDGKPGIPLNETVGKIEQSGQTEQREESDQNNRVERAKQGEQVARSRESSPKIRSFFWENINKFFN